MKRFVAMIIASAAVLILSGCGGDSGGGGGDESNTTSSTVVPTLANSTGNVAENSGTGTSVGTVTVSDAGDSAITAITLSGTGSDNFSVSTTGAITVASGATLDYESTTSYALKAKATNSAGDSAEVDVTITVTDVADVVPTLAAFTGSITENSAAATSIGTITISDAGDNAISAITLSGTGSDNFSVSTAGAITVASGASLDYESTTNYALKAKATNDAGESAEVDVAISVTNVTDVVPTLASFTGSIAENSVAGTSVGTITISDAGDSAITAIALSGTGSANFSVSTAGAITVASGATLDYESTTSYALKAKATNDAGESAEVDVTISVTDVVDVVPTLAAFTGSIAENSGAGAMVGMMTITDAGDSAITAITLSGTGSDNFSVSTTGKLTVAPDASLDYESTIAYALKAKATNDAGESAEVDVTIDITDVADVVPVLAASTASIAENSAEGASVGTVTISDPGDSAITEITLSGAGHENFSVDTVGHINVAAGAALDYEATASYALTAKATNSAGDSTGVDVTITLTNVAEFVPTLAASTGEVIEHAAAGTAVGTVTISDQGDTPISSMTLSGTGNENFAINAAGNITVAAGAKLIYALTPSFTLKAKATNDAGDSASVNVAITVLKDTDKDGISDRDDPDDDNDGVSDRNEQADGTDPLDASSLFRPFKILVEANDDSEFTVPVATDYSYNYRIDCDGDGVYEEIDADVNKTGEYTCLLDSEGNHTITLSGIFPHIFFQGAADRTYLLSVEQWGDMKWKSFEKAFSGCSNMIIRATDTPDLSAVNNMDYAFSNANTMNQDIGSWDVSHVTTMERMFNFASQFNQGIGGWDVSNVTNMKYMFVNASAFDQNISGWDVGNVTEIKSMFAGASQFNQDIGDWNISNVTDLGGMFSGASHFNQDISGWDVGNVTDMSYMFSHASDFDQDIRGWNVGNVTTMRWMFHTAASFHQDLSGWDVHNVTTHVDFATDSQIIAEPIWP